MTAKKAAKARKTPKKKASGTKPVFADTRSQLHTIPGAKAVQTKEAAPAAVSEPEIVAVKAVAPVKKAKKQTVEQLIASGEVDPDHFVKWGDLKDRVK
jgi:hypothetical protein